jgi:hypothetical protein
MREAISHAGHRHIGRRQFMRSAAVAAGLALGSGLALPSMALADEPDGSRRHVGPVPIAGGDVLGPPDFPPFPIRQFLPGVGPGFDGLDAELNGITNFRGLAALGYTSGTATDNHGRSYVAQTDNRVYQGEYIGAHGERARGTFVEI